MVWRGSDPAAGACRPLTGRRLRIAALLAGALFLAAPVQAQTMTQEEKEHSALAPTAMTATPSTKPEEDIVVKGKPEPKPAEVREEAHAITRNSVKYSTPLAKFQAEVCPGVVGMPVDMAGIIIDRIRVNAERVGMQTAPLGHCTPNILVIFVRNGQAVIKELHKKQDYIFKRISLADVKELIADPGPVHAWTNTEVRSRQGDVLQGDNDSVDLEALPVLNVGQSQSHIFLAARLDISNSIIMIDIPAINGMAVVQIADYVTMRTFAMTNPVSGDPAATTILSLFDADAPHPRELTDFDLAYLRTVYGGLDSLNAASKLASINGKLRGVQAEKLALKADREAPADPSAPAPADGKP